MSKIKRLLLTFLLLPIVPTFFVPDDSNSNDSNNDSNSNNSNDSNNDNNDSNSNDSNNNNDQGSNNQNQGQVVFQNQAEFDRTIQRRINKVTADLKKSFEDERKKAQMSENEKLKFEKEEAEKKANEAINQANQTLIQADVISKAIGLNIVDPTAAFALMDKSNIEIKNGQVYGTKESLENLIKDKSYLIKNNSGGSNYRVGDDQNNNNKDNEKMDFNSMLRKAAGR